MKLCAVGHFFHQNSPVIKTLETHFFTLSECDSDVLISGECNLDEVTKSRWQKIAYLSQDRSVLRLV